MARIINTKVGPEAIIQKKIITKLRYLQWSVRETHGNMYQCGFPDLFCCHYDYGARWVEVKDPNRTGDVFTKAQHEYFSELMSKGVGVWILTSDDNDEIKKLFQKANFYYYLGAFRPK